MILIDSHCHLDFPDFASELPDVIARAQAAGVSRFVTISTRVKRIDALIRIASEHPAVFFTIGTHPHNAAEELDVTVDDLVRIAEHPKCVGIGEAGLDYHYDKSPREAQAQGLRTHITAARITGLPLVIHARAADADMIAILSEESQAGAFPAILHCFSSGAALAQKGVELGFYVSFSGILTFRNSEELRAIARNVPKDRLLVETDAPYLAPVPYRGKRNEPAFVAETAKVLASVHDVSPEEMAAITTANALRCFAKMDAQTRAAA
jgi:TatD DNase family protein